MWLYSLLLLSLSLFAEIRQREGGNWLDEIKFKRRASLPSDYIDVIDFQQQHSTPTICVYTESQHDSSIFLFSRAKWQMGGCCNRCVLPTTIIATIYSSVPKKKHTRPLVPIFLSSDSLPLLANDVSAVIATRR